MMGLPHKQIAEIAKRLNYLKAKPTTEQKAKILQDLFKNTIEYQHLHTVALSMNNIKVYIDVLLKKETSAEEAKKAEEGLEKTADYLEKAITNFEKTLMFKEKVKELKEVKSVNNYIKTMILPQLKNDEVDPEILHTTVSAYLSGAILSQLENTEEKKRDAETQTEIIYNHTEEEKKAELEFIESIISEMKSKMPAGTLPAFEESKKDKKEKEQPTAKPTKPTFNDNFDF